MILTLIGRLKKYAEPVIILVLGVLLAGAIAEKVLEIFAKATEGRVPASLTESVEKKVLEAEKRSKEYADEKAANTEKLIVAKHEELLRAVAAVNTNVETLRSGTRSSLEGVRQQIFELQRDIRRGVSNAKFAQEAL